MKDFLASFVNTNGVAFPNTAAVNSSGGGATDGTEFVKIMVDDFWGWMQALLNYTDDTPNGNSEVGASQLLTSMQKMRALITTKTDNSTHTVYDWNKLSVLILDTGCTTGRIEGSGADRSNKIIVYNKIAGTVNIDFGVSATQEVLTMQKDQWIEFIYDNTLGKFVFQKSNKEIIITVTSDYTIGDWVPSGTTFICNPNTVSQYGVLIITLSLIANSLGKRFKTRHGVNNGIIKIVTNATDGSAINCKNMLSSYFYVDTGGDEVELFCDGTHWGIKGQTHIEVGWQNRSDLTNVHIGNGVTYDTKSAAVDLTGQNISWKVGVGDTGNTFTATVIYDSGGTGLSGILYFYNISGSGSGNFPNNNTITSSDGTTSLVNETTGSNKNIDYYLYHNLNVNYNFINVMLIQNSSASFDNSWTLPLMMIKDGAEDDNFVLNQIDKNSVKIQSGKNYSWTLDDTGTRVDLSSLDYYCHLSIEFNF